MNEKNFCNYQWNDFLTKKEITINKMIHTQHNKLQSTSRIATNEINQHKQNSLVT